MYFEFSLISPSGVTISFQAYFQDFKDANTYFVRILFELVLFSMPTVIPVTLVTMNYASVVFAGFLFLSVVWYIAHGHKGNISPTKSLYRCTKANLPVQISI